MRYCCQFSALYFFFFKFMSLVYLCIHLFFLLFDRISAFNILPPPPPPPPVSSSLSLPVFLNLFFSVPPFFYIYPILVFHPIVFFCLVCLHNIHSHIVHIHHSFLYFENCLGSLISLTLSLFLSLHFFLSPSPNLSCFLIFRRCSSTPVVYLRRSP